MDKKELFRYPVTRELAPDYFDIVSTPMSFNDIIDKLSAHRYLTLDEFESDLSLIWRNSMLYNKTDTTYYKLAQRLEKTMGDLMAEARRNYDSININENTGLLDLDIDSDIFSYGPDMTLTVDTTVQKEKTPTGSNNSSSSSSSELSSLSTLSSDSTINSFVKRRASDITSDTTKAKKRKISTPVVVEEKKVTRVTRSKSERNKRNLRSRSITKDSHHPVKIQKPIPKKKTFTQVETVKEVVTANTTTAAKKSSRDDSKTTKPEPRTRSMRSRQIVIPPITGKVVAPSTESIPVKEPPAAAAAIVEEETSKNDEQPTKPVKSKDTAAPPTPKPTQEPIIVKFEHGEIVWARVRGFPSHPAKVSPMLHNLLEMS